MLIRHKVKKKHFFFFIFFFLPTVDVLASASSFGFLSLSSSVLESFSTLWFFSLSPGSYTWKWRHLWISFLETIHRCVLLLAGNFPHPTITFLVLLYTASSFHFRKRTLDPVQYSSTNLCAKHRAIKISLLISGPRPYSWHFWYCITVRTHSQLYTYHIPQTFQGAFTSGALPQWVYKTHYL